MAADDYSLRRWLSFSNNDQKPLSDQTRGLLWDAIVVPGTLATYYRQGVGGYVLSRRRPFVIDPRTPLLQDEQGQPDRPEPKSSHVSLARIHHPDLEAPWARGVDPPLEWWTQGDRWSTATASIVEFQRSFEREAAEKIEKYEGMLREAGYATELDTPAVGPARIVPPYFACRGSADLAWLLTRDAIATALRDADRPVMPVLCVAADAPTGVFAELIADLPEGVSQVFCWRSLWQESDATAEDLDGWLQTIDLAAQRDIEVVNMYGGALSIFLTARGLFGVNSGVGYSESRDSRRLAQTGGAPPRYYVPRLHAFYTPPVARLLIEELGVGWSCECAICQESVDITRLDPLQLKLHFLLAREDEWAQAAEIQTAIARLAVDGASLTGRAESVAPEVAERLRSRGTTLGSWADLLARELPL